VKRDPSLASLSRDHHQALAIAQKLRRTAADNSEEARQALLAFWQDDGRAHFRLEESALARDPARELAALHALGRRLDAHARLEERELFPLIESAMTATDLAALARALSRAESSRDE
jgi:hypothetical protein